MYGRKKLQKENEANLSRLADSDTTKKFEDEPAEEQDELAYVPVDKP